MLVMNNNNIKKKKHFHSVYQHTVIMEDENYNINSSVVFCFYDNISIPQQLSIGSCLQPLFCSEMR